jgi:hypothetical protein
VKLPKPNLLNGTFDSIVNAKGFVAGIAYEDRRGVKKPGEEELA